MIAMAQLNAFDPSIGLIRGRPIWFESLWYLTKCLFFLSPWPWPYKAKVWLLRMFGATIGKNVKIKPRVNIHFPWKMTIGNNSWIGEEVFILNLENVNIGSNVCISQRAFLCTGNHDYRDFRFLYRNAPIQILDGAWIGASAFIGPGVIIGSEAVASAGSVVFENITGNHIVKGNPAKFQGMRWLNKFNSNDRF